MTSSEERREVAERLREDASCSESSPREVVESYLGIEYDGEDVLEESYKSESLLHLADLIDPTCSMDAIDTGEMADYDCCEHIMYCRNCDAEFGYVLYSEDGDVDMDYKPKFCPNCGSRVVGE